MTAQQFIEKLKEPRRSAIGHLRKLMRASLPQMKEKVGSMMGKEMIMYETPNGRFFAALASGKNYMSIHIMSLYFHPELAAKFKPMPKGVKMGKACINFTALDQLPLELIGSILKDGAKDGKLIDDILAKRSTR
jgi:hypothetical protein